MNLALIGFYFLGLLTLKSPRKLFLAVIIIFSALMGGKIYSLINSGAFIESELLAPVYLSPSGSKVFHGIGEGSKNNPVPSSCLRENNCPNEQAKFDAALVEQTLKILSNQEANKSFTSSNRPEGELVVDAWAVFRGRYLHHYSTVLYPVREIRNGNFGYALTSQYGLISLIPLLVVNDLPFTYYTLVGLIIFLLTGIFLVVLNRKSIQSTAFIAGIIVLIALTIDIPALRFSPGFSFLRYLPFVGLITIASMQFDNSRWRSLALASLCLALFNSVQFNILYLLVASVSYVYILLIVRTYKDFKILIGLILVALVTVFQIALYYLQANSFTPPLFSSVGEGERSVVYSLLVMMLPVALKLLGCFDKFAIRTDKISFTNQEILSYVSYGFCASYAISFANSPQHFSGFLVLTSFSTYIIFRNNINGFIKTVAGIILLSYIPYSFNYITLPKKIPPLNSSYLEYKKLGTNLYFESALNIEKLSASFKSLIKEYSNEKVYFLSRDKVFIETFDNENLEPRIYDIYPNLNYGDSKLIISKLKNDNVHYLVLDNRTQREFTNLLVTRLGNTVINSEFNSHQNLLKLIDQLADQLRDKVLFCNDRYCLYKLEL